MGHVRIGFLPRTRQWNAIVEQLSQFDGTSSDILRISNETLNAIKNAYTKMPLDESIQKSINFLATLVFSAKQDDQINYLKNSGYLVDDKLSLFSLVTSAKNLIKTENGSLETNKIAKDATMQAIIAYYHTHQDSQLTLFGGESQNPIQLANNGAAFCEMARSFFAEFTDRQIKYYLERTAASTINDYSRLDNFTFGLRTHSKAIADHAFEISNIMQSFAAGWFNKHAISAPPSQVEIRNFLRTSFNKMREEFRREAEDK